MLGAGEAMSDQPVAIVTGGASGIGLGIASTLIADGYDVFVLDNDLQHVDDYNTSHPLSRARVCDVSDARQSPPRSMACFMWRAGLISW